MDKCPVCKDFIFKSLTHRCPPLWHVHLLEYEEPGQTRKVYADSAREAAEIRAANYDAGGDYPIISSGEVSAVVWDAYMENPIRFDIEARMDPVYDATESNEPIPAELLVAEVDLP